MILSSLLVPVFVSAAPAHGDRDPRWRRYLSFQENVWGVESSVITSDPFFLSKDGRHDPRAEWDRSLAAFRGGETRDFDGGPQPLRCLFPYRAELIEELSGESLPRPACPDLDRWAGSISAHKLSVVFAGAYTNNPASLFGHTFLRFSRFAGEDRGQILRSYSAGYMATIPAGDGEAETIVKGLLGLYTGFFDVKPHYMNAALYNNSESRDLWEYPLKLSGEEVRRSVLLLWEQMNFAGADYYFLDRNCSHRLLAFIETLRPDLSLTARSGVFVLPLDTVRILKEAGLVDEAAVAFEPSLNRRLQARFDRMTAAERALFREARRDPAALEAVANVRVMDALIDDWTKRFYAKSGKLAPAEDVLRETTLRRRATLGAPIDVFAPEDLRPRVPPDEGHRTSWWEARAGGGERGFLGVDAAMGAHDLKSSARGYDGFAAIEYFSVGLRAEAERLRSARLTVADVAALNAWTREEPLWSWAFDGGVAGRRESGDGRWFNEAEAGGSFGMTFGFAHGDGLFAVLPELRVRGAGRDPDRGAVSAGARAILRYEGRDWLWLLDARRGASRGGAEDRTLARVTSVRNRQRGFFIEVASERFGGGRRDSTAGLGIRGFF